MSNNEWYKKSGKYFGYPHCCIEWFCRRRNWRINKDQRKIINGEGFIPCPVCAKKLIKENKTPASLISNRIHPEPFPNDDVNLFLSHMNNVNNT